MTFEIALVLTILLVALVLFVFEWIPMDVTALLVLGTLALTGLVDTRQAFSGFSNPAVITVWAMFILSEGLTRTGVANQIGQWVLKMAGSGEVRLIMVVMLTAGGMSAIMNNIGVAALMLPVVIHIARRTGCAPSRLLMPLAYGTLLGGLTTLIGTPPNLLVSAALRENGLTPFGLFSFTPVGMTAMLAGVAFVALLGRFFLPKVDPAKESAASIDLGQEYALGDRSFVMRLRKGSLLDGTPLGESRLGSALGLTVVAITREGRSLPAPSPDFILKEGDSLITQGLLDRLEQLQGWQAFALDVREGDLNGLVGQGLEVAEVRIAPGSWLEGKALFEADFRNRFGAVVLVIRRDRSGEKKNGASTRLASGDRLLVQGQAEKIAALETDPAFDRFERSEGQDLHRVEELKEKIFEVSVPDDSVLIGLTLAECRLGDAFGLRVLGIDRAGVRLLLPEPDEKIQLGDQLIIHGTRQDLRILRGLQELEIESGKRPDLSLLDTDEVGMVEATLAPRSSMAGGVLRQLHFRERLGVQVLAIWRGGRAYRSNLRDMRLEPGDAFLVMGSRDRLALLQDERDLLILTPVVKDVYRTEKAPWAALIMGAVLVPVLFGWLTIAVSAVCGVVVMVLAGCLKMDEAYRAIEWRAVFLIAGMIPLGAAMQDSGAASFLAEGVVGFLGPLGPWPVIVGLYLITAVATTIIPTAALVLLMAPITLQTCGELGVSPLTGMMAIAMAASASFTSPISHPANILVMGPGGYRFIDYLKLGIPLALVVFLAVFAVLPIFWPLHP
jgi:di/tricarboxylate transporter